MSKLKVNRVVNADESAGPELTFGATVPSGQISVLGDGVSVAGVLTCGSLQGNGAALTNLPNMSTGRIFAVRQLFKFDEYRS